MLGFGGKELKRKIPTWSWCWLVSIGRKQLTIFLITWQLFCRNTVQHSGGIYWQKWNIKLISMFSSPENKSRCVFVTLEWAIYNISMECHVSSPEQINQTLALDRAIRIFASASIVLLQTWHTREELQFVAICNLTARCRQIVHTAPLIDNHIKLINRLNSIEMAYFCWPTRKLASPWFPQQKANGIFPLGFGLLQKIRSVANTHLWYLHVLFSKIIFTNEHHFYDFWSVNAITRSKKLTLGYKSNYTMVAWTSSIPQRGCKGGRVWRDDVL